MLIWHKLTNKLCFNCIKGLFIYVGLSPNFFVDFIWTIFQSLVFLSFFFFNHMASAPFIAKDD